MILRGFLEHHSPFFFTIQNRRDTNEVKVGNLKEIIIIGYDLWRLLHKWQILVKSLEREFSLSPDFKKLSHSPKRARTQQLVFDFKQAYGTLLSPKLTFQIFLFLNFLIKFYMLGTVIAFFSYRISRMCESNYGS